jgi:hypothetical protein
MKGFVLAGVETRDKCFCANEYTDLLGPIAAPITECNGEWLLLGEIGLHS